MLCLLPSTCSMKCPCVSLLSSCYVFTTTTTTIHVTGFKKLHGVSKNPTETIANNLTEYMNKKGLPKGLVIGSSSILEIAGQGALVPLYQRLQSSVIAKDSESSNSNKIIWVSCPCTWYMASLFVLNAHSFVYSFFNAGHLCN